MSMIKISNLSFNYDTNPENIFENVSFVIDTNWRLGFIGRNGKGKTTFLNLLLNKYDYSGTITYDVSFDYFPFEVNDKSLSSYQIAEQYDLNYEQWKFEREVSLMNVDTDTLKRPFNTLSKGEQTKILLAILFLKDNNFLLIDEPTNHLDTNARKSVSNYLKRKKGFILVSHDRSFLDECVDHILSINRNDIQIEKGNFSSWYENKKRQDNFELSQNEKFKKGISRLEQSARKVANWSDKIESSKYNIRGDLLQDKGYIGHKAAKMMKKSKTIQSRKEKEIEEKSKLLKNIESIDDLKLNLKSNKTGHIIEAKNLSVIYGDNIVLSNVNFYIEDGDRLQLKGKNGCGKSSILKIILGENIEYLGELYKLHNIKISYVSQDTSFLCGTLSSFAYDNKIDETLFKTILRKMDFDREQFNIPIENFSEGEKKKILIAKSISEQANVYIWDEPLNYIDIFTRMQIENIIKKYNPTMIFVEHDETFSCNIATKKLILERNKESTKIEDLKNCS